MSFTIPDFRKLSLEETSPFYGSMTHGIELFKQLQQSQYLPEMLKAQLAKSQLGAPNIASQMALRKQQEERASLMNQFLPQEMETKTAAQKSLEAFRQAQMEKMKYGMEHPGYQGGQGSRNIQALIDMGFIKPNQTTKFGGQPFGSGGDAGANVRSPSGDAALVSGANVGGANVGGAELYSGNQNAPYQTGHPLVDAELNKSFPAANLQKVQAENYNFNSLPVAQKNYMLSMYAGLGIDPVEAKKLINKGETVETTASRLGLDPSQVQPNYLLSPPEVKLFRQRNATKAEVDKLEGFATKALGEYSGYQAGKYSLDQIKDHVFGLNKDKQAEFLAAYMAEPEITGLRLRLLNAPAGITSLHEIMDRSYGRLQPFKAAGVSREVFEKSQKIFNRELTNAVNAANSFYEKPYVTPKADLKKIPNVASANDRTAAKKTLDAQSAQLAQDNGYIESDIKPINIGVDKKGRKIGYINGLKVFIE